MDLIFPPRPDHPDLIALDEAIFTYTVPEGLKGAAGRYVDEDSVVWMAHHRTGLLIPQGTLDAESRAEIVAMWLDGFVTGVRFHRPIRDGQTRSIC